MTQTELNAISEWCDLRDAMSDHHYNCDLTLYELCESADELLSLATDAARFVWRDISDLRYTCFDELDEFAEAWLVSGDFSHVENLYDDTFREYFDEFETYLVANDCLDDDPEEDEAAESYDDYVSDDTIENDAWVSATDADVNALLLG